MNPRDRRPAWPAARPLRSIYQGAAASPGRADILPRPAGLGAPRRAGIANAAPAVVAADPILGPSTPGSAPADSAAAKAAAEKKVWEELKPGIYQSLFMTWIFSALYWKDIGGAESLAYLAGLIFAILIARTALLFPRRLPLFLAAYLPYNAHYALKIPGVPAGNMTNAILILMLVGYVSSRRQRRDRLKFGFFEYLVITFLCWGMLSTLNSQIFLSPLPALRLFMAVKLWTGPMIIFFMIRALIRSREDIKALFVVILVSCALVSVVCIKEGLERHSGSIEKSRIKGPMGQANTMGAYLAYYGVPMFCVLIRHRGWRLRAALAFGLLLVVKAITYCFSRGAYLAFGGGCFLVYLLRNPLYLAVSLGLYAGAASQFPDQLIPSSVVKRMGHTQSGNNAEMDDQEAQLDKSAYTRLVIWRAAGKMIPDHPLLGVGLAQWNRYLPRYDDTRDIAAERAAGQHTPTDAHNAYILTAGELGIPAAIMMVMILVRSLFTGIFLYFQCHRPLDRTIALSLFGATFAMIFSCMFGSRFTDECLVGQWWIMLAMIAWIQAHNAVDKKARPVPGSRRVRARALPHQ